MWSRWILVAIDQFHLDPQQYEILVSFPINCPVQILVVSSNVHHVVTWTYDVGLRWNKHRWIHNETSPIFFNWCPSSPNQGTSPIFFMKTYCLIKNWANIIINVVGTKHWWVESENSLYSHLYMAEKNFILKLNCWRQTWIHLGNQKQHRFEQGS